MRCGWIEWALGRQCYVSSGARWYALWRKKGWKVWVQYSYDRKVESSLYSASFLYFKCSYVPSYCMCQVNNEIHENVSTCLIMATKWITPSPSSPLLSTGCFRCRMQQSEVCRRNMTILREVNLNTARLTPVWSQPVSLLKDQTTLDTFSSPWFYIGVARLIVSPLVDRPTRKTPTLPDGLSASGCQYPFKCYSE